MNEQTAVIEPDLAAAGLDEQELEHIVLGAVKGNAEATAAILRSVPEDRADARMFVRAMILVAQQQYHERVSRDKDLKQRVVPAMIRARVRHNGRVMYDVEVAGQRLYARVNPNGSGPPAAQPQPGEEAAVAMVQDGTPLILYTLGRQFETTGQMGLVVDVARVEDGDGYLLEVESNHETFTCRATAEVCRQIEDGEVDALGGLPIRAVYSRGFAWKLCQGKGRSEQSASELQPTTLDDYAGYTELRTRVTLALARHVLSLEPSVLVGQVGIPAAFLKSPFRGVFSSGLPGTGKSYLTLAIIGSLRRDVGAPKVRAKRAAIDLYAATHPDHPAFERAGQPDVAAASAAFEAAVAEQYAGLRALGLPVDAPGIPADVDLAKFSEELLAGYGINGPRIVRKMHELGRLAETNGSDFMVLTLHKEDYIRSYVGEGLGELAAQLKRARNHDDLAVLCLPEAEVLLSRRGHQSRFYTDELVSKLLEVLDGPAACRNLFLLADGNRLDMVDSAFFGRRLDNVQFHGLHEDDRTAVIDAIIARDVGASGGGLDIEALRDTLLDLIYATTEPICRLVMADKSTVPLPLDKVLTPAMIQNTARTATGFALAAGRTGLVCEDLRAAWERELDVQAQRLQEDEIATVLGLDRQQAGRVIDVQRGQA